MAALGRSLRFLYLFLALTVLLWYLPLSALVYGGSAWYDFNCQFHERCQRFGLEKSQEHAEALVRYFRHQDAELHGQWTTRERTHLAEVRGIYDGLFMTFLLAAISLMLAGIFGGAIAWPWLIWAQWLWPLLALALLPFFKVFWNGIFHDLFFNNDLWKYTRAEVSYYLMPNIFFRNALIAMLISVAVLLTLLSLLAFRWRSAKSVVAAA